MIKHIVFDIGNVLMIFAPETYFTRWLQNEEKTHRVCSRTFTHEAWKKHGQGIWTLEDLYAVYHDAYPDMVGEMDIVLQSWLQLMQPMQESIAFTKQTKNAGYGIYILSNISQDFADHLKEIQQFFPLVDGTVLSYEEKTNELDLCISEVLLERYEPNVRELLYLDNNVENTRQAEKMRIQGILLTGESCVTKAQKLLKEECHVKD